MANLLKADCGFNPFNESAIVANTYYIEALVTDGEQGGFIYTPLNNGEIAEKFIIRNKLTGEDASEHFKNVCKNYAYPNRILIYNYNDDGEGNYILGQIEALTFSRVNVAQDGQGGTFEEEVDYMGIDDDALNKETFAAISLIDDNIDIVKEPRE